MGDYRIRMAFDIAAEPATVTAALTTIEGITSWWSDTATGDPAADGGDLEVSFPDVPQPFHFRVDRDGDQLAWETQAFPPWWADTTISWAVRPGEESGTALLFEHGGFDPDADIVPIVTPAWAGIIERLKRYAETGQQDPFARN